MSNVDKFGKILAYIVFVFLVVVIIIVVVLGQMDKKTKGYSEEDRADAWVCAQDVVKKNLKSPSSAKFCLMSEATIHYNGEDGGGSRYTVSGYVDAQNSFGAMIRKNFTVNLTVTKDGYKRATCTFY